MKTTEYYATEQGGKPAQSTQILELLAHYPVFVDQANKCFIRVKVSSHTENWSIETTEFTEWLAHLYFQEFSRSTNSASLKDAVTTLKGKAKHSGATQITYLRAGKSDTNGYWLDVGDSNWSSIHVEPDQWTVKTSSEATFFRKDSTNTLPLPTHNGDISHLWEYVNIPEQDRILVITLLIDYLRPDTAHPLLVLDGEQGAAKSTTQRFLKQLIDPSAMPLRVAPKNEQDFFIAAANDYVLSYNNISTLSPNEQDALCNLSTGGTFVKRALYSDSNEVIINIQRPVMMNGIGTLVTAQDLLERSIYLRLPIINSSNRITEQNLESRFE